MRYGLIVAAAVATIGIASAADATNFPVGSSHFFITSGTPTSPSISAVFFNGFSTSTSFDDSFTFTIPQNGVGSGSLSTSFSGGDKVTIDQLFINGVLYPVTGTGSGQVATVGGVPITAFALNTIRVVGSVIGSGSYSGTATFSATPTVPEPASWLTFIGGFGLLGASLRLRRRTRTAVAFS